MTSRDDLIPLEGGARSVVHHRGDVVVRDAGPWLNAKLYDDIDAAWMIRQRRALETALARGSRL